MDKVNSIKKLIEEMSDKASMRWLFDTHTTKVAEKAKWLLEKLPEANEDIIMLSVWLHDIYYLIDISKENEHAALGAIETSKILKEKTFLMILLKGLNMLFLHTHVRILSLRHWKQKYLLQQML